MVALLTDAAIRDIAETRNHSNQWFDAEITFRNECVQNKFPYPPPGKAEKDRSRRQCARVKMKRQMIRQKLLLPRNNRPPSPPSPQPQQITEAPSTLNQQHSLPPPSLPSPQQQQQPLNGQKLQPSPPSLSPQQQPQPPTSPQPNNQSSPQHHRPEPSQKKLTRQSLKNQQQQNRLQQQRQQEQREQRQQQQQQQQQLRRSERLMKKRQYLYIHEMKNNNLGHLSQGVSKEIKDKHRNILSDAELVQRQIVIEIDDHGQLYVTRGLDKKPHSHESCSEREHNNNILRELGCELLYLGDYESGGVQHIPGVATNYTSKSNSLQKLMRGLFNEHAQKSLAQYVLANGEADKNRDSGNDEKRLFIGFGRGQKTSKFFKGIKMPTFNTKHLGKMPCSLQVAISSVLSFAQQRLQDYLESEKENTVDEERRNYVRSKWGEFYSKLDVDVNWDFEFVDINMRSEGKLLRHCDYKNDWRVGNDGCVVFSYSVDIGDKTYRVVMVMTSRCTVGKSFERIHDAAI